MVASAEAHTILPPLVDPFAKVLGGHRRLRLEIGTLHLLTLPFDVRSRCLYRTLNFFAGRVDGIDSITKGHLRIEFRRDIFARVQRISKDNHLAQRGK
jgi:hypothetical protein